MRRGHEEEWSLYLHIGHDTMIETRDIIAILNRAMMDTSPEFRQMVHRLHADGAVQGNLREAKTVILTDNGLVLSNISAATLYKRAHRPQPRRDGPPGAMWYTEI